MGYYTRFNLRLATENDLEEMYNLIQIVGKEMECKNKELFAYSKNNDTYLQMLKTGICAVAERNVEIIASLLTRPEDNRNGVFDFTGISKSYISNTIEFVTCQVLKKYRGHGFEQRLINFVLAELEKSKDYKYAICTVCPDNIPSLKSVENTGFRICATANLYGNKRRYVLMKELEMTNGSATKNDLKNKYVFWDIDGTLAPYRFNDHVADPDGTNNGMSLKEIKEHVFLKREPSEQMRKIVYNSGAKRNIIMGHCQVQQEIDDKQLWLDKYFPIFEKSDRMLTFENISKAESILNYCNSHNIDLQDVVYVDDVIPFLREAERKGIRSYHISSFLDWDVLTS